MPDFRPDQWESRSHGARWAHLDYWAGHREYTLSITDENTRDRLTVNLSLTELMELRSYIGREAQRRTTEARAPHGS